MLYQAEPRPDSTHVGNGLERTSQVHCFLVKPAKLQEGYLPSFRSS